MLESGRAGIRTKSSEPVFRAFGNYASPKGGPNFPGGSHSKVSVYNAGDKGSSPGLGRSPGEGNGNPLQYTI